MRIVIVEDDEDQVRRLKDFIRRFEDESGEKCFVETFGNGMDFISDYSAKYDLVLLDIEMPHMDGMSAAEKLRETDEYTAIIFVTNMAQYAVRGYSVDALDLSLKRKQPPLKVVEIKIFKIQEKSSCGILGVEVISRNEEKTTGGFYE